MIFRPFGPVPASVRNGDVRDLKRLIECLFKVRTFFWKTRYDVKMSLGWEMSDTGSKMIRDGDFNRIRIREHTW